MRKSGYLTHGHQRIPHQSILIRLAPVCPIMVSKRRQHFPEANATRRHAHLRKTSVSLKAHRHSHFYFLACYVNRIKCFSVTGRVIKAARFLEQKRRQLWKLNSRWNWATDALLIPREISRLLLHWSSKAFHFLYV